MYPKFCIKLKEVKEGWVEIAAPDEETARKQAGEGGFQSYGQTLCSVDKRIITLRD